MVGYERVAYIRIFIYFSDMVTLVNIDFGYSNLRWQA